MSETRLLRRDETVLIPPSPRARDAIDLLDVDVPPRQRGRTSAHREQFCLARLLRWLIEVRRIQRGIYVTRTDAPDFVVRFCSTDLCWALEHTDMGSPSHQAWMTATEGSTRMLPGDGWVGDEPERAWVNDFAQALHRKSGPRTWRSAPPACAKVLMVYDNAETNVLIRPIAKSRLARDVLLSARIGSAIDYVSLITGGEVFMLPDLDTVSIE